MNQTITGFKKEGRRFPKIVVCLDGQPWATLDPETVVRQGLATGQALSERRRREVLLADEIVRARKAAAGNAAHSPKTRLELEHFLKDKGFGPSARRRTLELLAEAGVVDDDATAGRVVRSRRRKGGIGPRKLEAELIARGVAPGIAARRVGEALAGADLAAECLVLARKHRPRFDPLTAPARRHRLAAYLMRRGYRNADVRNALRIILAETGIPEDEGFEPPDEGEDGA